MQKRIVFFFDIHKDTMESRLCLFYFLITGLNIQWMTPLPVLRQDVYQSFLTDSVVVGTGTYRHASSARRMPSKICKGWGEVGSARQNARVQGSHWQSGLIDLHTWRSTKKLKAHKFPFIQGQKVTTDFCDVVSWRGKSWTLHQRN